MCGHPTTHELVSTAIAQAAPDTPAVQLVHCACNQTHHEDKTGHLNCGRCGGLRGEPAPAHAFRPAEQIRRRTWKYQLPVRVRQALDSPSPSADRSPDPGTNGRDVRHLAPLVAPDPSSASHSRASPKGHV